LHDEPSAIVAPRTLSIEVIDIQSLEPGYPWLLPEHGRRNSWLMISPVLGVEIEPFLRADPHVLQTLNFPGKNVFDEIFAGACSAGA
jgi:hypothetical protein